MLKYQNVITKYKNKENRSEEHTSELQSQSNLVCRLLLEKKKQHHRRRCRAQGGCLGSPHVVRHKLSAVAVRVHAARRSRYDYVHRAVSRSRTGGCVTWIR